MLNKSILSVGGHHGTGIMGVSDPDHRDRVIEEVKTLVADGRSPKDHANWSEYFSITVEKWTLKDYLVAKLYHFYDMRIPPLRLWVKIEKYLPGDLNVGAGFWDPSQNGPPPEPRFWDKVSAWSINQDIRCYYLSEKHETILNLPVSGEEYRKVFPERPIRRRVGGTVNEPPTKEEPVGSEAAPVDPGEEKDAPQVEVTGDSPNVEVNPPSGDAEPDLLPDDDDSRAAGGDDEDNED